MLDRRFLEYASAMDGSQRLDKEYDRSRARVFYSQTNGCALVVLTISLAIFVAWITHARWLESSAPQLFAMKMNSTIGFGAASLALLSLNRERHQSSVALSLLPLLIGLLTLAEYMGVGLRIDELLLRDWSGRAGVYPGRPSLNSAVTLAVLGATFIILWRVPLAPAGTLSSG